MLWAKSSAFFVKTRNVMVAPGDVVAQQQKILEEVEIFAAVKNNDIPRALDQLARCPNDYHKRDTVGATPLHIAFLYQHVELGQRLVAANPNQATAVYQGAPNEPSPYEGENILHIAIVHRNLALIQWLASTVPDLLDAETTGDFFEPGKPCYFGGTPLLFALASRQLVAAKYILDVAHSQPAGSRARKTSIFMTDAFGNNALHLAIVQNAPEVYDFAISHAMLRLTNDSSMTLAAFLKSVHGEIADVFIQFLRRPNNDGLTPLALAAALGRKVMFQHMLAATTTIAWIYGPITAKMIPLQELEEKCYTSSHYKTALECLCSSADLTNCLSPHQRETILHERLQMLGIYEVKTLLDKKWKFVGKPMFYRACFVHVVFLALITGSTLITPHYRTDVVAAFAAAPLRTVVHILLEFQVTMTAVYKLATEVHQMGKSLRDYLQQTGAAMLDNYLCLTFGISIACAIVCRGLGAYDAEDVFVGFACLNQYLYMFFFMMGFRSTGPFVVMLLRMLTQDFLRFVSVYMWILCGISVNLYVIVDGHQGFAYLVARTKALLLAVFCMTFDYTVYEAANLAFVAQCLIVTYLVVVVIVLVNMLIAMMGNTYDNILEASEQRWYAERVNIMCSMEQSLNPHRIRENRKKYAVELVRALEMVPPARPRRQSLAQMLSELQSSGRIMETEDVERFLQVELVCNEKWLEDETPVKPNADQTPPLMPTPVPIQEINEEMNSANDEAGSKCDVTGTANEETTNDFTGQLKRRDTKVSNLLAALEMSICDIATGPTTRSQLAPLTPRGQGKIALLQETLNALRTALGK
ncbi:transient receptor potential cation channel subfamily V member 6 [Achlya hypogyna]|uniref:Transient receptor potential cation channel subfamily V member 6 n=1 Tax=Achlya hypogyna TaxID=1202772 RepID=A0A1V9Y9W3_ACHHY|nr:transient receptor potential cation channel subfamily V member 6 [Achlya hypogyna]